MANIKRGSNITCPCGVVVYIPLNRVLKHKNHYCSLKCVSRYTAESRAKKLTKKDYPFVKGPCLQCGKDIVVESSGFDKPNRKYCSRACVTIHRNKTNNPNKLPHVRALNAERARKMFTGKKATEVTRMRMRSNGMTLLVKCARRKAVTYQQITLSHGLSFQSYVLNCPMVELSAKTVIERRTHSGLSVIFPKLHYLNDHSRRHHSDSAADHRRISRHRFPVFLDGILSQVRE
jgi:hypothetical protein